MVISTALVSCAIGGGTSPADRGYQLLYHRSGTVKSSWVPGFGAGPGGYVTSTTGGLSIFTKSGLTYFSENSQVTIYKPGEGLFVRIPVDYSGKQRENPDATRDVNFGRPPDGFSSLTCHVQGLRSADSIPTWDGASANPEAWESFYGSNSERKVQQGYVSQDVRVVADGKSSYFALCESYLQGATVVSLPEIAAAREYDSHAAERAARQAEARASAEQKSSERRAAISQQGQAGFARAVAAAKQIGMTVCSSDNRVAYVEQVANGRIKLSIRGRALGEYGEFGDFGPRSIASPPTKFFDPRDPGPHAIEDPNFLFLPLGKPVRLSSELQSLWDEGRFWGACDYR